MVSAGMMNVQLQIVPTGYLLNITQFIETSSKVSKERIYRIFNYLAWGDFCSLLYKVQG